MARWCALALAAAAVVVAMMVPFTAAVAVPFTAAVAAFKMAQTVHEVGGASGWTAKPNLYTAWASGKTFKVGDTLSFRIPEKAQDVVENVVEVGERAYDTCSNAIDMFNATTRFPANLTLATPGPHFYICTSPGNCDRGQKLAVNVAPPAAAAPAAAAAPGAPALGYDNSASTSSRVASLFVSLFTVALGFLFY